MDRRRVERVLERVGRRIQSPGCGTWGVQWGPTASLCHAFLTFLAIDFITGLPTSTLPLLGLHIAVDLPKAYLNTD